MGSPRIRVLLDHPRTELLREGWGVSRPASAMRFATFDEGKGEWVGGGAPDGVLVDPNTRVIRLRPRITTRGFVAEGSPDRMRGSALDMGNEEQWDDDDGAGALLMRRAPIEQPVVPVSGLIDRLIEFCAETLEDAVVPAWRTKAPLLPNEGFGVLFDPKGTFTTRAVRMMALLFANRFGLTFNMNGTAEMWEWSGSEWLLRETYGFGGGGIDHTRAFQATVIPWGPSYIGILFSQASASLSKYSMGIASRTGSARETVWTYDIARYTDVPRYDEGIDQHVKTEPAPLVAAFVKNDHTVDATLYRVRYPLGAEVRIMPEAMPQPLPQGGPVVEAYGYWDFDGSRAGSERASFSYVDASGADWDPAVHTRPVFRIGLSPSSDGVWSPEVWQLDASVPQAVHTPAWTPTDVSEEWTYLRIQRTAASEPSRLEMKTTGAAGGRLLRRGGPIRIEADGDPVFDGYVVRRLPTPTTARVVETEFEARDMWERLEGAPLDMADSFEGKGLGGVLRRVIGRAGFLPSEIEIDPDVEGIVIEGTTDPNMAKRFAHDASVGDAVRELTKRYGLQGRSLIRVRWVGDRWLVGFPPPWVPGTTEPAWTIALDSGAWDGSMGDEDRWAAGWLAGLSKPEWTVETPPFNCLRATGATGAADGAEGLKAFIAPHPRALNDPTFEGFDGRVMAKALGPPEIYAKTQNQLEREARLIYDREQRGAITLSLVAEWRPSVDVDGFVGVVGRGPGGAWGSYGAYRLRAFDAEIHHDDAPSLSRSWTWSASYALAYVGPWGRAGFPMFGGLS